MAETFPTRGFIALCPSLKPESFIIKNVVRAVQRKVRGVMMAGEKEGDMPEEQEMIKIFRKTNFRYQFYINSGVGHVFPIDFSKKLLNAIAYIMD